MFFNSKENKQEKLQLEKQLYIDLDFLVSSFILQIEPNKNKNYSYSDLIWAINQCQFIKNKMLEIGIKKYIYCLQYEIVLDSIGLIEIKTID